MNKFFFIFAILLVGCHHEEPKVPANYAKQDFVKDEDVAKAGELGKEIAEAGYVAAKSSYEWATSEEMKVRARKAAEILKQKSKDAYSKIQEMSDNNK